MATTPITSLSAGTTTATTDYLVFVDVSDTSQAPTGSTLKLLFSNLFTRGTVTTSQPIIDATQTWNAGGVTFAGVKIAVTNTASAAASLPFQVLGGAGGATNLLSVRIDGLVTVGNGFTVTTGGLTVTAGTTAVQALTATTLTATNTADTSTIVSTPTHATFTGAAFRSLVSRASNSAFYHFYGTSNAVEVAYIRGDGAFVGSSWTGTGLIQTTLTTEQMRLRYDGTHFFTTTVGSGHQVTFNTSGTAAVAFQLNSVQKFSILNDQTYASVPMEIDAAAIDGAGAGITYGGTTQTTVGAAGGASALPAQPTGYIIIYVGSNQRVIPFYAAS